MDQTPRLSLPFIVPSQAQKHITHNEAIQALDALVQPIVESRVIATPPGAPVEGEAYLVPPGATGTWAGHAYDLAAFQSGAWHFLEPAEGWQVFNRADSTQLVFSGGEWVALASLEAGLPRLGVKTSADDTNRLAVAADASLLTHAGAGHQFKINKAAASDTASLLFQTAFSGRAEMGLMGDNQWRIKISPDGSDWTDALIVDATSGTRVATGLRPASDNAVSLGAAGARWTTIWAATGTIQTSDPREKTDISPSDLGLDFILALNPVRFRYKDGSRRHYGLIAQEVAQALGGRPFAGHILADPENPASAQGLRYDAFIAPLIAAVQQLAWLVADLPED
ncbi:MAG TPA: DUF2793 domain-containing protein [Devosia sp.]